MDNLPGCGVTVCLSCVNWRLRFRLEDWLSAAAFSFLFFPQDSRSFIVIAHMWQNLLPWRKNNPDPLSSAVCPDDDASNVQIMCAWCQKVGVKRYSLSMGSELKSFCSEKCFAACRRAYFKRNKVTLLFLLLLLFSSYSSSSSSSAAALTWCHLLAVRNVGGTQVSWQLPAIGSEGQKTRL